MFLIVEQSGLKVSISFDIIAIPIMEQWEQGGD